LASIPRPKLKTSDHTPSPISSDFATGTKLDITQYSNYSHSSRSSSRPIFAASQNPTWAKRLPTPQKISKHHIAILVPRDELVMKSYMHVHLAIAGTHYHNLKDSIKSQEYWPLNSNVGIKIQKAQNCSTGLKPQGYFPTFWAVPFCRI